MSRIGRAPIKLGAGVTVEFKDRVVTVKGPMGTLTRKIENDKINVTVEDGVAHVTRASEEKAVKAAHGLYRALIHNMVEGVEKVTPKTSSSTASVTKPFNRAKKSF